MSVIRKKPYIEALLATMSDANLKDLHVVLNSGGDNVNLDFEHLTDDYKNKVTPVYFQLEDCNFKTGILIWTNSKCALICYHRFQDLVIYELSPTYHTFTKINEYCDINELRRVLDDTLETKGTIESGDAEEGTLPFADGEGGATWDKPVDYIKGSDFPDGSTSVKMIAIDDDGDLVKVDIPEGTVVVDSALSDSSENPVQNKIIDAALTEIKGDVSDIETALETKANVDGNYPTMTVGVADNLTPYDESAGDDQDDPFSFQATGTGNGSQADFATGALALMKEKRGNSVVVNQLARELSATYWAFADSTGSFNDGVATFTATAQYGKLALSSVPIIANHKYLAKAMIKTTTSTTDITVNLYYGNVAPATIGSTDWQLVQGIIIPDTTGNAEFRIIDNRTSDWDAIQVKNIVLIDLTQWFNGDIPADLLSHPENFFRYYQGSLAYNAGQIVNANSRYIKCIGRQQWDEEWEINSSSYFASKNKIRVISGATYYIYTGNYTDYVRFNGYDENGNYITSDIAHNANVAGWGASNHTFVISENVVEIDFELYNYGTTYNNDITISLYYEGESGYDQYYPYEVLTNNDTGTETLLSAGNVADSKTPDGTITRNVGTRAYESGDESDPTLLTDGTNTNYPLATPTTEQGTPFSENLVIDDFGSMEFSGTSGVPQGNLIFYPVDYKAFVDTLYDYTEGTPSDIQLKSKLSTAITAFLTGLTGYDATKKQTLKNNEGVLSWEDDE